MWIALALTSAFCLGVYDVMKKLSVRGNNVPVVLMLTTVFSLLLMLPFIISAALKGNFGFGNNIAAHALVFLKAVIVLGSWLMGYFAIKHLPLTVQGPINASRPIMVLVGAMIIFGERLNALQWAGLLLGFASLFLISRIGAREGSGRAGKWVWLSVGAAAFGAISALYDKFLLRRFTPVDVQSWFAFYQCLIMIALVLVLRRVSLREVSGFTWRWTIPLISLFLTGADALYFYVLSHEEALVSVVSMLRRGSVVVPFFYSMLVLRERNIGAKAMDLMLLMVSLGLLVVGST